MRSTACRTLSLRLCADEYRSQAGFFGRWRSLASRRGSSATGERGIYLWGGVGRGKTFLMDLFHTHVGVPTRREHFHRLMKDLHARLGELRDQRDLPDPLQHVAADIARDSRVLCLDELFVSDIADAMLLGGLFAGLFERGVTLVFTSNLPPSQLYRDGLQRQRFLPAISAIERHCEVINVDGGEDYRLRLLERAPLYLDARLPDTRRQLEARFADLCGGGTCTPGQLVVEGRDIAFVACEDEVVPFHLDAICDGPRLQVDFVEIAQQLSHRTGERGAADGPDPGQRGAPVHRAGRRVLRPWREAGSGRAHAPIDDQKVGDRLRFEFDRTRSRLAEMQTHEYLARPGTAPNWRGRRPIRYNRKTSVAHGPHAFDTSPLIKLDLLPPYRLPVLANVTSNAIAAAYEERFGLTIPEWRVIAVLMRHPGLSAREVAERSRMDAVAVSRAVNRLLRAGRLRRAVAADDRRRSILQVSAAGAAVYRDVAPIALEFERSLLDTLTEDERAALDRLLGVLTQRAEILSVDLRAPKQAARGPAARRPQTRRDPTR